MLLRVLANKSLNLFFAGLFCLSVGAVRGDPGRMFFSGRR